MPEIVFAPKLASADLKHYRFAKIDGKPMMLHRARAVRALGRPLPPKVVVHHVDDENPDDSPLVICENQRYHWLLHVRLRTLRAGGDPDTQRVCWRCRTVKDFSAFSPSALSRNTECRACNTELARERRLYTDGSQK